MNENQKKSRFHLTDAGKTVLRGTCFVAMAALIVPAFGVLSALISVLLVALLVGFILRPRIEINGDQPERIVAGETVRLNYLLKNIARVPTYNLSVRFEALPKAVEQVGETHVLSRLGPGETAELILAIRSRRRGHYQIKQPVCESSFPFNLFSFAIERDEKENLVVLPVFSRLHFPVRHLGQHVSTGGTKLAGIKGIFPEYAGNRPFMAGDSPRSIDSRAWARLAAPAIKEYHDDFDNHTALVLDTVVPKALRRSNSAEIAEFEAAVSLCASVAYTINNDCLIGMMLAGSDLHLFDGRTRRTRLDSIHDILAGIEPDDSCNLEQSLLILGDRLYDVSEVIFVLMKWNETYEQLLDKAAAAGCRTTVIIVDGMERMHKPPHIPHSAGNVRFVSAEEVLKGRVRRL